MKKIFAIAAAALIGLPSAAFAVGGIVGQCADCHTMHNSEQGQPVAQVGLDGTVSAVPIQNLLRMDCIACHAQDPAGPKTALMDGGSTIPQVYHGDATGDLAAGNFAYIDTLGSSRKGHNVSDLFTGGDDNAKHYGSPPGKYYDHVHAKYFSGFDDTADAKIPGEEFSKFTCAGAAGCHGTRSNLLSGNSVTDPVTGVETFEGVRRTGIAAVSGAHHNNYDGKKDALQAVGGHDGLAIADSYRFIDGLKGTGNTAARWQNVDASSHNEYFGAVANATGASCNSCHVPGTVPGVSSRMTFDSTLKVPNQSMSGFCITCHGNFHSTGLETGDVQTAQDRNPYNGTSGAFLRHPSDYVIPDRSEYAAYTTYNITAPVARPTLADAASPTVTPGTDLVMCLSCHQAHATEFDGMLRFDYADIIAGNTATQDGCLACHTTKGVAK